MNNLTLTKKILDWYDNNKRVLPWRKKYSQKKREYFTRWLVNLCCNKLKFQQLFLILIIL